jgi:hypothetical protein
MVSELNFVIIIAAFYRNHESEQHTGINKYGIKLFNWRCNRGMSAKFKNTRNSYYDYLIKLELKALFFIRSVTRCVMF